MEVVASFVFASLILAFSPGPDVIFVLTQSIVNGRKYTMPIVLGLVFGCIVHTTLLAFGLSVILKKSENLFFAIKIFGATYLLYLAYKVFMAETSIVLSSESSVKKTTMHLFGQGFIMNVFNPKVSLFFLAFFPSFLFSSSLNMVVQFYILGLLFMLTSLLAFSLVTFLAGSISKMIKGNKKIGFYLKWMQIIVYMGIAFYILI